MKRERDKRCDGIGLVELQQDREKKKKEPLNVS